MSYLKLDEVSRIYGGSRGSYAKTALDHFSLEVEEGEFTGVMGPSGSGKTTLLNIIATIDRPSRGTINLDGKSIEKLNRAELAEFRRTQLGFVFQDSNLLDTLTIRENILLPLLIRRVPTAQGMPRLETLTSILGIEEILDKYPVSNSGGQKQRAAIARALVGEPKLLLADEPTGALDSRNSRELMESFEVLQQRTGTTILLVTHDPQVASYCRRIVFIKDGRVYAEIRRSGSRDEFYRRIVDMLYSLEEAQNAAV